MKERLFWGNLYLPLSLSHNCTPTNSVLLALLELLWSRTGTGNPLISRHVSYVKRDSPTCNQISKGADNKKPVTVSPSDVCKSIKTVSISYQLALSDLSQRFAVQKSMSFNQPTQKGLDQPLSVCGAEWLVQPHPAAPLASPEPAVIPSSRNS